MPGLIAPRQNFSHAQVWAWLIPKRLRNRREMPVDRLGTSGSKMTQVLMIDEAGLC